MQSWLNQIITLIYIYMRKAYMVSEVKWTKFEMANQNMQYCSRPQDGLDWRCRLTPVSSKTGEEEVELLLRHCYYDTSEMQTLKWNLSVYGQERRPGHTSAQYLDEDHKDRLKAMLDTLEDWTRPKSDEIAAFTHLRALTQGNKTLSAYIQEVRRIADLCNFACVGDCKDRLIRNSIMAGLSSTKAYQQCISKGSSLTSKWMHQDLPDRRCNMQTSTSPSIRVCRLHRQYINTQNSAISTTVSQAKLQGQRRLQRPTQRWQI